jgi:hypothetical protein
MTLLSVLSRLSGAPAGRRSFLGQTCAPGAPWVELKLMTSARLRPGLGRAGSGLIASSLGCGAAASLRSLVRLRLLLHLPLLALLRLRLRPSPRLEIKRAGPPLELSSLLLSRFWTPSLRMLPYLLVSGMPVLT